MHKNSESIADLFLWLRRLPRKMKSIIAHLISKFRKMQENSESIAALFL
jgi:hypothetical protein